MTDIILFGAGGRMGRAISALAAEGNKINIVAGVDPFFKDGIAPYPIYSNVFDLTEKADAIVDFSHHSMTADMIKYALEKKTGVVIATTGHDEAELELIKNASKEIPVLKSGNMSLGINLLMALTRKAAQLLPGFDIEIVEEHHKKKLDAPSGTAKMLAEAAAKARGGGTIIYDRHSRREERGEDEIGISSVRGGSIVGEHQVIFAGDNEVIRLSHSASSRELFATGALTAAEFISKSNPGYYTMEDIFN